MAFDLLSRFRKPLPPRDSRGHLHIQRPPQMIARSTHAKRPPLTPPVRPQIRRGRDPHQAPLAMVPHPLGPPRKGPVVRAPPPSRKGFVARASVPARRGPAVRVPARPHPPQRGPTSKLMNCLHIQFPPPRSSKHGGSQQAPPFPPPRGTIKAPSRHVHWAPAQAPLPSQPYPYPSHTSSRTTTSQTTSQSRTQYLLSPRAIPRYQPPAQLPPPTRDLVRVPPHKRR